MDEQVVAEINRVLFRLDQDFNSQSNTVKKQLLKIQEAISDMETVYASSKEAMRDSAINISNVSKKSGVSRKTFYNNQILKQYVEQCASLFNKSDSDVDNDQTIKKYQDENRVLKQRIKSFLSGTACDYEELKCDHDDLVESYAALQFQYENLQRMYEQCIAERDSLQREYDELQAARIWN